MRRQAIIGALVIVGIAAVLGATVFRTDIAQATGLAASVTVSNTAANPLPVREQNTDGNGNIKVHEQGTANVDVQGPVATQAALPANSFSESADARNIEIGCGQNLPAGTRWFLTSFSVTNNSTSDTSIGILIQSRSFPDVFGPTIAAKAGETGELTFPQPYVLTSPRAGDCLVVGENNSIKTSLVGYYR